MTMLRCSCLLLCVGLLLLPLTMGAGCDPLGDLATLVGGGATDLPEGLPEEFDPKCGLRTVEETPQAGYVEMTFSMDADVTPSDSGLAKALFGENPGQAFEVFDQAAWRSLYEVAADGVIVNQHTLTTTDAGEKYFATMSLEEDGYKFIVDGGCLMMDIEDEEQEFDPVEMFVPGAQDACGEDALPLSRQGFIQEGEEDEHICIRVKVEDGCVDCSFADNAWHQKIVYTVSYTALGSLNNIPIWSSSAFTEGQTTEPETVNVAEGDRVEVKTTLEMTYSTSSSPTELGYEEQASMWGDGYTGIQTVGNGGDQSTTGD